MGQADASIGSALQKAARDLRGIPHPGAADTAERATQTANTTAERATALRTAADILRTHGKEAEADEADTVLRENGFTTSTS